MGCSDRSAVIAAAFLLLLQACTSGNKDDQESVLKTRAELVADSAVAFHGSISDNLALGFSFRDRAYSVSTENGKFKYEVIYQIEEGRRVGTLTNDGYSETVNGGWVSLTAKDSAARAESINSVVYFALLPAPLNDPAAKKYFDGEEEIDGKKYYRIKVAFSEVGGGKDHDDVFLYWFDIDDYSMDYLAYSYNSGEGGTRFRAAQKSRRINGVLFQDYTNYKGPSSHDSLQYISSLYKAGFLPVLSSIELSKVSIRLMNAERE